MRHPLKLAPISIEAESSVLGGLLLDAAAWSPVSGMLMETDFYRHEHRLIFRAMENLVRHAQPVDVITVYEELEIQGEAGDAGGLAYLNSLAQYVANSSNIRRYAEIVMAHASQRRRESAADQAEVVYTSPKNLLELPQRSEIVLASGSRWDALLASLSRNPRLVHEIEPRAFEELIAELLTRDGLEVTLTRRTRDGGRDILAFADSPIGRHLYYVECKRYAPSRPVDVSLVRQLYGVVEADRATAGLLVTTSRFTSDEGVRQDGLEPALVQGV
jgi:HJR/Mrr/RecB family endonuclease